MASFQCGSSKGRDFNANALVGRRISAAISIEGQPQILADGELIKNVSKFVLTLEHRSIAEAKLTLSHPERVSEEITLQDNLVFSFLAPVSEVR